MSDAWCKKCGGYARPLFGGEHRCPPQFQVMDPEYMEDWDEAQVVYAHDHKKAVRDAAEMMDNNAGEPPSERMLMVRKLGEDEIKKFDMTFDWSVNYYAGKVE